jgi:N-acyl-L-homoserine lactone synthetase
LRSDDLTLARAADILDDFTRQFIQMSPTVRFAVAQSPEEREAVYRARYTEVIQQGWAKPEEMPDGIERDEYDDQALHLVGWEDERMVIVGRLVFPSSDRPLPTETAYKLRIEPFQQVVDTGRAILIQADRSDPQHKLFLGLMGFAWQEMLARSYYRICATMTGSMLRLYRLMGIHWQVLGDSRLVWGEQRYPCSYDLVKTVQSFMKHGKRLLEG